MRRYLSFFSVLLLSVLVPSAPRAAEYTPDSHTLALYHFNEGSGTTALDAGPNGLHGTLTGATYATGQYGAGLDFCGNAGCYVRVPHNALLQPPTGITVEAWIYNRGGGAVEATIARYADNCSAGYRIRLYNDAFSVIVNGPSACGGQYVDVHADATAYLNQWAHYAFTYDAAVGTRLYINDALVASAAPVSYFPQYTGHLFLGGATVHPNDGGVNGIMDEVRISDVARVPGDCSIKLTAPTNLTVENPGTSTSLDVSWDPVEGAARYVLSRSTAGLAEHTQDVTGTSVRDVGLNAGTTYTYRVRAENACGSLGPVSALSSATPNHYPVMLVPGINADASSLSSWCVPLRGRAARPGARGARVSRVDLPAPRTGGVYPLVGDALACADVGLRVFVMDFGDANGDSPTDQAVLLADGIDDVLTATNERRLRLVAHSMGGLTSRYLIQIGATVYSRKVTDLVMIATPNHGSDLATQLGKVSLDALKGCRNELQRWGVPETPKSWNWWNVEKWAFDGTLIPLRTAPALADLAPGSDFLNRLNYGATESNYDGHDACTTSHANESIPTAAGTQYWTLAGTGDCDGSMFNAILRDLSSCLRADLGEDCVSDGIVPVASVQLQSLDDSHEATEVQLPDGGGLLATHVNEMAEGGLACRSYIGVLRHPGIVAATRRILMEGSLPTVSAPVAWTPTVAQEEPALLSGTAEFSVVAFPNPSVRDITLRFATPEPAQVSLRLYDPAGRLVRVLVDQWMPAGQSSIVWDRTTDAGRAAGVGVYFYELRAGEHRTTKKLLLLSSAS